jgi:tetratricopeptide (TPR) repeat protein
VSLIVARTDVIDGKYPEAIAQLQRALAWKDQKDALVLGALGHAFARGGQRQEALHVVDELKQMGSRVTPFGLIWAYAGLGDNDNAFALLEQAYGERRDRMVWLNVDPLLDPIRSDPRFDDLVRRVGLPAKAPPRPR